MTITSITRKTKIFLFLLFFQVLSGADDQGDGRALGHDFSSGGSKKEPVFRAVP